MAEIATAWVTLAVSADRMQRDINRAFKSVDADGAGRTAGRRFSDAAGSATNLSALERKLGEAGARGAGLLGKALKAGAAGAAGAAAGLIGTALVSGFSRLTAIDDAKGKLAGLGNSAEATAKIMDSALASVKGTAYGLGDAATIAASAVAAGVKPGQQLTDYLKMTADAASIAGTSLSDMGAIINQVRTGQTAYTDDLNQLAGRGLPIYQWVASEMGVAADAVKKLASDGKISSEIFEMAIRNNIGGAALKSGQTVRGAFENLKAALGRAGATALEGGFAKLPALFASATAAIDNATPKITELVKAFESTVFDEWIPKAKAVFDQLKGSGDVDRVAGVFRSLSGTVKDALPSILKIGESLGKASAAVGVSTWKLFLAALETAAGVLKTVAPLLETVANLMSRNQGLVTALVAGWVGFRTVPGILSRVSSAFMPVSSALAGIGPKLAAMRSGVAGAASSWGNLVGWMRQANPGMSTAKANMTLLKNGASGLASGGLGLVKGAASGLVGVLGGPLNVALMGATALFGVIATKNSQASAAMDAYKEAVKRTETAQRDLNTALLASNGLMDDAAKAAAQQRVQAVTDELDKASQKTGDFMDRYRDESGGLWGALAQGPTTWIFGREDSRERLIGRQAELAGQAKDAIDSLKRSQSELADQVEGDQSVFDALVAALEKQGAGGYVAAEKLKQARTAILGAKEAGATAGPVLAKLGGDVELSAARIQTAFAALPTNVPINVKMDGGQPVYDMLVSLNQAVKLDNDKNIEVTAPLAPEVLKMLEALGYAVRTENDKLIVVRQTGAQNVEDRINQAARDRTASISVVAKYGADIVSNPALQQQFQNDFRSAFGRADGAIVPMAFGGLRQIRKPDSAGIYAGRGAGTIFAEQETGGEAYIPLAAGKRGRSTRILAEVARLFGLTVMESGGITVDALKQLASGISGQPYRWGAGNGDTWATDCSGAQATITNAITGRFSTGTQAAALLSRGFQQGDPPAGIAAYWIGWRSGGPGGGHTAGTIVDPFGGNVNVEMGGRSGGGQYGGTAAGAADFPTRAWIALAGGDDPTKNTYGSSAAVRSASASVSSSKAAVTSAQASLQAAEQRVDELKAEGASADKIAVAEKRRDAAQEKLAAAEERQSAAETRLAEVKDKAAASAEQQTGQGPDGQSLGQSIIAGMLQSVGLDGSLFSNPLEWPNVKSVMAGLNYGGGLLSRIGAPDGVVSATGGGGPGLPDVTSFLKPVGGPMATEPIRSDVHTGSGAAPGPAEPGIVVNGNIGMDPRQFTQRVKAHQNEAVRRNLSAVRPQ